MKIILGGMRYPFGFPFLLLILLSRDYVGAILGLVKHQSSWRLDPLMVRLIY